MATAEQVAQAHYRRQKALASTAAVAAARQWDLLDRDRLTESWQAGVGPAVVTATTQAQLAAAQQAPAYLEELAEAQGGSITAPLLIASTFAGVASDGRPLASLLFLPVLLVKSLLRDGISLLEAFRRGRSMLTLLTSTQVADAGRAAVSVGMTTERRWVTYIRTVTLPACGRCIILAGKEYSWSTGFLRHPRCDCGMTPRFNTDSSPLPPNPAELFRNMTPEQQNKAFTNAGAAAIRDGADIGQVVNARRGMTTAAGRSITTEGTTVRGLAGRRLGELKKQRGERYRRSQIPRPTPEQIYKDAAGDRELAIQLLKRFAYIV
ncbi:hypothetical protein HS041_12280 [Planomonospora sp. ID67723]|uniref:VG15 protein n=1 Tax=Planomonospora sp. ID67723 TaxID=2738134 RepID=UPI0018C365C2|nr:hypothetical protein [Planomonospora sp. ID67723]MBG0828546.1 hypothetical protein [Planomonospora sp. ID67723]